MVRVRGDDGEWDIVSSQLQPFESMMESIADPQRAAEVLMLRDQIRTWRFYDHFRTDADAPARQLQIGTYTPVLAHDGRDLAAAMQTIVEIGDSPALAHAIADAFPGSELDSVDLTGDSLSDCVSMVFCGPSQLPSCRTARYVICFGLRLC